MSRSLPSSSPTPKPSPTEIAASGQPADGADQDLVNLRSVVEAILFVGNAENRAVTAAEIAASLSSQGGDTDKSTGAVAAASATDVEAAVGQLNTIYAADGSAFEIAPVDGGFRLVLRQEYHRVRDRFYGRTREAKLSQSAMEVLALVAYHQPMTADAIQELRGTDSRRILRLLVRRQLLAVERPSQPPRRLIYRTTARFLQLFRLQSLDDLPASGDLDRS